MGVTPYIDRHIMIDLGHLRSPHANLLCWLVPNGLPTGKKAEMRQCMCRPNQRSTVQRSRKISLEYSEENSIQSTIFVLIGSHDSVSHYRNHPGGFLNPHANVLGMVVPPPHGKDGRNRPWVDLTNEAQHRGTHKVSLECEKRTAPLTIRTDLFFPCNIS